MPGKTDYFTTSDGLRLAVRASGRGIPWIWSHGLMGSMRQDRRTGLFDWSSLAGKAHLLRYDARGHGESDASPDPSDYTWRALAGDMLELARQCGPAPYVLGGVSMGCGTALHAACRAPAEVAGLVLAIPPAGWELRPAQTRGYRVMARILSLSGNLPFRIARRLMGPPRADGSLDSLIRAGIAEACARDPRITRTILGGAALSDLPRQDRLAGLDVPALILAWDQDRSHPLEIAQRLERIMPRATLHCACDPRQPAEWLERVSEFLDDLE